MNRAAHAALRAWLPVTLLLAWEGGARVGLLDPLFFPPPTEVLRAAVRLTTTGELVAHLAVTLMRLGVAFAAAAAGGLACGVLMGLSHRIRASVEPLVSALYTTPKIALLPMLFVLVGVGEPARLAAVASGGFIIMAQHALDAIAAINRSFVEVAINYGANRWQLVRRVYLPSALPQIFTGLRLAFGRTLVMVITVEVVGARNGLGSMIWIAGETFAMEKLYVGILIAALLGGLSHAALRRLEAILVPWKAPQAVR
ncbi:MAG TPA: ABC transporter permease [Vicinamibacterales bacterium]|nr:ABC transporter permease [Vicinamibacterales bacterium]